jgi:mono/diheme cytochrome c family protein
MGPAIALSSIKGRSLLMKTLCAASILVLALPLLAADKPPEPAQSQRGRQLFLTSTKGVACGTCHSMAGVGTAIAPDLTNMATYAPPRGLVSTMHMTMTEHVLLVKTNAGNFPGLLKQKQGDESEFWDLSQTPPVVRKLASKEIVSVDRDQKWQHPPSVTEYTPQELADLIGFLRWAASGSVKVIKPADVE